VFPVRYELEFHMPEDVIIQFHISCEKTLTAAIYDLRLQWLSNYCRLRC
jgi:hypothetical protein